jgi:uncharacterized protein (DUF427 family)
VLHPELRYASFVKYSTDEEVENMARAIWNGAIIAEAAKYEKLEGNVYFPPESLHREYLRPSQRTSVCPWKGIARYYDVVVADKVNAGGAWYYPDPKPAAARIKDHVGFWQGVTIEE